MVDLAFHSRAVYAYVTKQGRAKMQPIANISLFVAEAHRLAPTPDAFRAYLDDHRLTPEAVPALDPHGPEYRAWVLEQYRLTTGREYATTHEAHAFDESTLRERPWPYNTGSALEVGNHLQALGAVISAMNLQAGAKVLEMGIGCGTLAIHMARYGVDVEGVDIESRYQRIVAYQSERAGVSVPVHLDEFLPALRRRPSGGYDVVLFFESFHHSPDHLELMREARRVLRPGGRLVLAGEAVETNLEYPWGLNPSGIGVFTIALHGWLELALREDYLLDTFTLAGFTPTKIMGPNAAGICYIGS